jgi:hypothetical protein
MLDVKKTQLDVYTIPEKALRKYLYEKLWVYTPPEVWEIKEAELTDNGIQFTFCFTQPYDQWKKFQGIYHADLRLKLDKAFGDRFAKARNREIDIIEATDLNAQEMYTSGIQVIRWGEDEIFKLIYDMKYPSFWGSFFKPEAWLGSRNASIDRKITKVELIDDNVEFTMVHVRVP